MYQPADSLNADVMDAYARVKEKPRTALFKPEVEVIGIYSPVKRTGKTSFALTLGQLLAGMKAVLYLNLEDYAGFEELMGKQFSGDISDLMYFSGSGKGNLISKLGVWFRQSIIWTIFRRHFLHLILGVSSAVSGWD